MSYITEEPLSIRSQEQCTTLRCYTLITSFFIWEFITNWLAYLKTQALLISVTASGQTTLKLSAAPCVLHGELSTRDYKVTCLLYEIEWFHFKCCTSLCYQCFTILAGARQWSSKSSSRLYHHSCLRALTIFNTMDYIGRWTVMVNTKDWALNTRGTAHICFLISHFSGFLGIQITTCSSTNPIRL
jgi:hypothetical protein